MDAIQKFQLQLRRWRINNTIFSLIIAAAYIIFLLIVLFQNVDGDMSVFIRIIASSFFYASLYFMVAAGLSIVFGLMDVLNLAQGSLVTLGAYIGFQVLDDLSPSKGTDAIVSAVFLIVMGTIIASGLEGLILRVFERIHSPLYPRQSTLLDKTIVTLLLGIPFAFLVGLITDEKFVYFIGAMMLSMFVFYDPSREFVLLILRYAGSMIANVLRGITATALNQAIPTFEKPVQKHFPQTSDIIFQKLGLAAILGGSSSLVLLVVEQKLIRLGLAIIVAMFLCALVGILLERFFIRLTYSRPLFQIILTFGFGLLLLELIEFFSPSGSEPVGTLASPTNFLPSFMRGTLPDTSIQRYWVFMIIVGLAMVISVQFILQYTRIGMIIRAGVQDREMVEALGINVSLIFTLVFALGVAIAAVGGITAGGILPIGPALGDAFLLQAITVVIIGGLGSYSGTALACVMVGLTRQVAEDWALRENQGALAPIFILMLLCVFLMFKPNGLFGKAH